MSDTSHLDSESESEGLEYLLQNRLSACVDHLLGEEEVTSEANGKTNFHKKKKGADTTKDDKGKFSKKSKRESKQRERSKDERKRKKKGKSEQSKNERSELHDSSVTYTPELAQSTKEEEIDRWSDDNMERDHYEENSGVKRETMLQSIIDGSGDIGSDAESEDSQGRGAIPAKLRGTQKHLEDIKKSLGLTQEEINKLKQKKEMEMKNCAAKKKKVKVDTPSDIAQRKRPPPELVVYDDPRKRKKRNKPMEAKKASVDETESADEQEFDLKQARHEVQRFGIKGMDTVSKEEATLNMLIKLGAKPPKQKYQNYKEYMQDRKEQRERDTKQKQIDKNLGYAISNKKSKKKKRDINDVGYLDGQVGRYKHGMQVVSGGEIDATRQKGKRKR